MKAFLKKEWMEWSRTGRMLILLLVFALFGIMNPAIAKLTPWMMENMAGSLSDAGLVATAVQVDAMTSWVQFYKNIPVGLIIFILVTSGNFTSEYEKGTLIPVVTRGLARRKIMAAKAVFLIAAWTVLYALCFGITYGYNAYFWDNGIAGNLFFAAAGTWLFGVWAAALQVFFSSVSKSSSQVLLGTGGVALGAYLLGIIPKLADLLPVKLMNGTALLQKAADPGDYYGCIAAAGAMVLLCMAAAVACFDRKQL